MYFSASKLTGGYGGVNIIEDCSFNVNKGEIVSILGPNGAGKSTAMKAMLGILELKSGEIIFDNQEKGYTFCMIEHDFNFISELCDPIIVLAEGSVLFKGKADEVKKNEAVIDSYLGKGIKK